MGEGEGDDLAEIGRVRQDLLVAGERGVEHHLRLHLAGCADAAALNHGAVGKNEHGGRLLGGPRGCRGHLLSVSALEAPALKGRLLRAIYIASQGPRVNLRA